MNMKKIAALLLALLMTALLVSCSGSGDPAESTSPAETTGGDPSDSENGGNPTESGDADTDAGEGTTEGSDSTEDDDAGLFDSVAVNEMVYLAVDGAYYRSEPDAYADNIVGRVVRCDAFTRTRYNDEWSVILISGEKYYIPTDCLSKNVPAEEDEEGYREVDEVVYTIEADVILRTAPVASEAAIYMFVDEETEVHRVGIGTSWSIVFYNGLELYAPTNQLSESRDPDDDLHFDEFLTTLYVSAATATIYDIPSTNTAIAGIVATVEQGVELDVYAVSEDGAWYRIEFLNPTNGKKQMVYIEATAVSESNFPTGSEEDVPSVDVDDAE